MNKVKILLFCFLPFYTFAQVDMEVGIMVGGSNYFGELTEDFTNLEETKLGIGVFGRLNLHPYVNLQSHVLKSRVSGHDKHNKTYFIRNFSFDGDLTEMAMTLELNIFQPSKIRKGVVYSRQAVVPYLFGGVAYTIFNSNIENSNPNQNYVVEPFPEPNDETAFISLPGGGGLKFFFKNSDNFRLDIHSGLRYVLSDYFDGISINGYPLDNDWYIFVGMNMVYRINASNGSSCYKF
jgi:hypothetical protein